MERILFGFQTDMSSYPKMEVFFYLLVFAMAVGIIGKMAFQKRIVGQYPYLIRYETLAEWWHDIVRQVVRNSIQFVLLLFMIGAWIMEKSGGRRSETEWIAALTLWIIGFCTMALVQLLCIQLHNGYKIIFGVMMCIEILSLYLPGMCGSWLMYERSRMAEENGFSVWIVCVVQIVVDVMMGRWGYHMLRMGRNHEHSN